MRNITDTHLIITAASAEAVMDAYGPTEEVGWVEEGCLSIGAMEDFAAFIAGGPVLRFDIDGKEGCLYIRATLKMNRGVGPVVVGRR